MRIFCSARPRLTMVMNGGLGNQMFQYAAAFAFAKQNGYSLQLNTGAFTFDYFFKRSFNLECFDLINNVSLVNNPTLARFYIKLLGLRQKRHLPDFLFNHFGIIERSFFYDQKILNIRRARNQTMSGYWQDERYFKAHRDSLIKSFNPIKPLSVANNTLLSSIKSKVSPVAIHFRRSHDQAASLQKSSSTRNPINNHSTLQFGYYKNAFAFIEARVHQPTYFIFSDDPDWVKRNFKTRDDLIIAERNRGSDWEDMYLMRRCKHHVIANSSFSWWGAWLGDAEQQLVVAPKKVPYTPNIPATWNIVDSDCSSP